MANPHQRYPIVLTNLNNLRCIVVGGGAVAERKTADLLRGGAQPVLISPEVTRRLACWIAEGRVRHVRRRYRERDLDGATLVIAATNDPAVNAAVAAEGQRRGMLVNVADDGAAGNFHTVASIHRGDLLLTVSTGGASPALSAWIRADLEARYSKEYELLLNRLRALRGGAARALDGERRGRLWRSLLRREVIDWLRDGAFEQFDRFVAAQLERLQQEQEQEQEQQRTVSSQCEPLSA